MIKRKLYQKVWERREEPEAVVVTGMRQVGKTTLLKQIYEDLPTTNKLWLDLENPANQKYFEEEDFEKIKYRLEVMGLDASQKCYVFFDEIQFARNIPSIVKYLFDHYKWKFFLTGSSSFYLKNLFSESLVGRKIIYEMFPVDFEEFLQIKGVVKKIPKMIDEKTHGILNSEYREFVEFGGFPGVVAKPALGRKKEELEDIFKSYYNKEVLGIGGFRDNATVRDLMLLLGTRIGSKLDIGKLAAELGVTRKSVYEYLDFLEGTYFISLIKPYSTDRDVEVRGARKVYFCDSGLANSMGKVEFGQLLENMVYNQLRSKGEVNYYQRRSGVEIDFVVNALESWEVKTRADGRDLQRLKKLATDIGLTSWQVVSFEYGGNEMKYGFEV